MYEITKYVKLCRIKFNCINANAAIHGVYYFLSIYVVRNKTYIYINILAVLITGHDYFIQRYVTSTGKIIQTNNP
jgi:hypothetical protein